jgi:hypothetical protein
VVLCVAAENAAHHGFAIATQLGRGSALGAVWYVARQQVHRSLARLRSAEGPEPTVMLWRREAITPTPRFLDALDA